MNETNSPEEKQRLQALNITGLLDTAPEPEFDGLVALAARVCNTPIALVALMDEKRLFFKARYGLQTAEAPREHSFCAHAVEAMEPLVVQDTNCDPRFRDHPLVLEEQSIRFYAGAPLILEDGFVIGTLCVLDTEPREISPDQIDSIQILAKQAVNQIRLRRVIREREQNEERYHQIFDTSPQPMWVFDAETLRFLEVSQTAIEHYGYSREEFLRMTIRDIRPLEDVPALMEAVSQLVQGLNKTGQWRHQLKDGSIILVEIDSHAIIFNGRQAFVALINDVTERCAAEAVLREQSALLENAQRIGRMGSWRFDVRLGKLDWSEATCSLFGIEKDDFGGTFDDFLSFVVVEDRLRLVEGQREAAEGSGTFEVDYRIRRADGEMRWMYGRVVQERAADGTPIARLGMVMDITERKQAEEALRDSEQRFRLLFRDTSAGIAINTFDGQFVDANDAYCQMLGYTHAELLSLNIATVCHPDDRELTLALIREVREGKRDSFLLNKRYIAKSGSVVRSRVSVTLTRDSGGAPRTFVSIAVDITAEQQANERLAQTAALLRIAGQAAKIGGWRLTLPEHSLVWSDEVCALHEVPSGYSPNLEEAIAFHSADRRLEIARHVDECIQNGTPFDFESEIVTVKGRRLSARVIGEAIRDSNGMVTAVQGAFQDITERKDAEEKLQREQALARIAGKIGQVGGWALSVPDERVYWSREVWEILGFPRDQEPSSDVAYQLYPPLWREKISSAIAECISTGTPFDLEVEIDTAREERIWVRLRGEADRDARGKIRYVHGAISDISDHKRAEKEIRRTAERLERTLESVSDAFFTIDRDWRFTYLNSEAERLLQRDRTTLLGRNIWEEFPESVESSFDSEYRRAFAEGRPVEFERYYPPFEKWFQVNAYPSAEGLAVSFRDITEPRRNAERITEQAALLDKAQDAILVRGLDHRIMYWNQSAERLYGWTAAEAVGQPIGELLYRNHAAFDEATAVVLTSGEWVGEIEQIEKSGRPITVEGRWTLVRDDQGEPKSILAINTDITQRKQLEAQFLRAQRLESLGTLAGGIAHDLNNLLSPIVLGVDLLKQIDPNPKVATVINNIDRSARRGTDLVKQVLSFARGVEGTRHSLKLDQIIGEVEAIVESTFPKNIRFESERAQDLWTVVADPTQLNQVLLNLCVNARDAMPDGGLLSVSASNVQLDQQYAAMSQGMPAGKYVLLQVSDEGFGMSKETLDRIFDPFFTTKELGKGTGLGLSTVVGILRSHGGFVDVASEERKGTVFKVYLPVQEEEEQPVAPTLPEEELPCGHGETILVVDDEVSILSITKHTLETFGYRPLIAEDGAEAVSLYALHRDEIALVITDTMMPIMDGPALIAALRRINPDLRIVAATGLKADERVSMAAKAGVRHFLDKPYSAGRLLTVIKAALAEPA